MKIHPILCAMLVFVTVGGLCADELPWQTDYDQAMADAATLKKPVLLDFSASWCGPCRMMETTTFADPGVQGALKDYLLVKVDLDQNAALAGKYAVNAIPACFLLNQFGERVAMRVGYADASGFGGWLAQHRNEAFAGVSKNQAAVDHVKSLGAGLDLADPAARNNAVDSLLEIYCAGDATDDGRGAKLAEDALRGYVQRQPAAAVPSLGDRRLAARILFAALFAEKLGPDFRFDPWAKSDARAAAVAAWTRKLGPP